MSSEGEEFLCDYEKERLKNIKKNQEVLRVLGNLTNLYCAPPPPLKVIPSFALRRGPKRRGQNSLLNMKTSCDFRGLDLLGDARAK